MTENTMKQLNILLQCPGGKCPNHDCICYGEDGCKYESILSKINSIIKSKFINVNKL